MKVATLTPLMLAEIDVKRTAGRKRRAAEEPKPAGEGDIMRLVMIALSEDGHFVARANVGLFYTKDGRPVRSGLPVGFSDLFGFTVDGRPFFFEVKSATGRLRPEQVAFLAAMKRRGAVACMVRSVADARQALL